MTYSIRLRIKILCLSVLAVLSSMQLAFAQSEALSLEEIVTLKRVSAVRMNPAGNEIAYLLSVHRELYKDDDGKPYHERNRTKFGIAAMPATHGKTGMLTMVISGDGMLYAIDNGGKYPSAYPKGNDPANTGWKMFVSRAAAERVAKKKAAFAKLSGPEKMNASRRRCYAG